jgi:hypothetical protein
LLLCCFAFLFSIGRLAGRVTWYDRRVIRRAARISLDLLTVASLLLCVAAAGAWGRSYWRTDCFTIRVGDRRLFVETDDQRLSGWWTSRPYFEPTWKVEPPGSGAGSWRAFFHVRQDPALWPGDRGTYGWLGFLVIPKYHQMSRDPALDVWFTVVGVPFYFVFWTAALLPAVRVRRALGRRRRRRLGLCPACGYDCRATPERCPECGRVHIAAATPATKISSKM